MSIFVARSLLFLLGIISSVSSDAFCSSNNNMSVPKKVKLTYFNVEGSAECVRLALALAGVEYTDDRIEFGNWKDLKEKTPYGQVPIMILDDDESKMRGQSGAMMRYIAHTFAKDSLYPSSSLFDIEEVLGVVEDMRNSFAPAMYMGFSAERFGRPEGFSKTDEGKALVKSMREKWVKEELPKFMGFLEAWLDKNDGKWLATSGDAPSLADCAAIPFLRTITKGHMDHVPTTVLDDYPKIVAYVKRFCALEPIKGRYTDGLF